MGRDLLVRNLDDAARHRLKVLQAHWGLDNLAQTLDKASRVAFDVAADEGLFGQYAGGEGK